MRLILTLVLATALLAGCQASPTPQAAAPDPAPANGIGYLFFNAPVIDLSRDLFITDVDKLRGQGATEIRVALNSPGGDIDAAQGIVDYMRRLHEHNGITFKAYNVGVVASAATYVFLNAQDRYSIPKGAFLFHAAGMASSGLVNAQTLRETADKLDAYERIVRATLKTLTKLSDAEAQTYVRRTVILTSDDARRDGVVDAIASFTVPPGVRTWVIAQRVAPVAKPPVPPAAAPN